MQLRYHLENAAATEAFAQVLATSLSAPLMIGLSGEIGMGKTCLIRAFLQAKGVSSRIKSPSFTLLEIYDTADAQYIHLDLYRMHSVYELEELGFRDVLHAKSICCIEWPERAPMLLGLMDLVLEFAFAPESQGRRLLLKANSSRGQQVLAVLQRETCLEKYLS